MRETAGKLESQCALMRSCETRLGDCIVRAFLLTDSEEKRLDGSRPKRYYWVLFLVA